MPVLNHYRMTKYDPARRDASGAYTAEEWTAFSDVGKSFNGERLSLSTYLDVEATHLVVLASFLDESGTSLVVADGVENHSQTFHVSEGARLSPVEATDAVRQMLREEGWCRLADDDRFYIHVGWDYYVYVGTEQPCERSVALAEAKGLYVDRDFPSPYLQRD